MKSPHRVLNRGLAWLQGCGILFIIFGLGLALAGAAWNFWRTATSEPLMPATWAGMALYLVAAGGALYGLHRLFCRFGARVFIWTVILAAVLIQLAAICATPRDWKWTSDAAIFNYYLNHLADGAYSAATLEDLSQYYDYRVWTRRALPFYYLLRVTAGSSGFMPAAQAFQALLIVLALVLTWRIARLFFGRHVAFWAVSLQLLMPYRWFICIDLNHHVLGGFYFLAGLWILAEWLKPARPPLQTAGLTLAAAGLLPLMHLEGGIDTVFAGAVFLVLLFTWLTGRQSSGQLPGSAVCLLGLPMLAAALLLAPLSQRIETADRYHHESGAIAFMARGWAPETGGEYCRTYETIDIATPAADKKSVQASILASQAFYNPQALLVRLLPEKIAKYFLLGYASGAEEMLVRNRAIRVRALAEGARTAFLLAALPVMIWGGWLLLPRLRRNRRLALVVPCAILSATYVLLGETSPRYSFYIQPFLFMLAALPLALPRRRRRFLLRAGLPAALPPLLLVAATLAAVVLLLAGGRPALAQRALQDMRTWGAAGARTLASPPTLAPFEIQLAPEVSAQGTTWGPLQVPDISPRPAALTFYALPEGAFSIRLRDARLVVTTAGGRQTNSLPARIRLEYPDSGLGEMRFRSDAVLPYPLRIGYVTYEFHEKATK